MASTTGLQVLDALPETGRGQLGEHSGIDFDRRRRLYTTARFAERGLRVLRGASAQRRAGIVAFMAFLQLTAIIVDDYDDAIAFFTQALGFELAEDSPARTNDGRAKRWVVVRPPGGQTGILLARADGERQKAAVGNQHAGRVGFFLRVDDFDASYQRMQAAGVEFLAGPRTEPYGRLVVFRDIAGNRWDLLGP